MDHFIKLTKDQYTFTARSNLSQGLCLKKDYSKLILLLHGFPDTNDTFRELFPILEKHYPSALIVAPTLRGYESTSIHGQGNYSMYEIASDVKDWILLLTEGRSVDVHIVGHDWGAVVAFKTASMYPSLVKSMVTLAIPYLTNISVLWLLLHYPSVVLQQLWYLSYMITMQVKALYLWRFKNNYLEQLWRFWSPDWTFTPTQSATVMATLSNTSVLDAATGYYRCVVSLKNWSHFQWHVDFDLVPTLILGGQNDGCMVASLFEVEQQLLSDEDNAQVRIISQAGHFMHRERPDVVGDAICSWFDRAVVLQ